MTDYYDALETRDPAAARGAAAGGAAAAGARMRSARRPALRRDPAAASTPAQVTQPRGAGAAAGDAQARAARRCSRRARQRSVRRLLERSRAGRACRACFAIARPDLRARRARRATTGASARALFAAGFRAGDLVHNCFSYHLTPAGSMMESGAHALGCTVFPAAPARPSSRCRRSPTCGPTATSARRASCKILLEKAAEIGIAAAVADARRWSAARPSRRACATGSPSAASPATRATAPPTSASSPTRPRRAKAWCSTKACIVEIVRPGTGDPVPDGEVGEVVVTTLNPDYPLIRFGTGDLSAVLPGAVPDRPHQHAHPGWLGRADQTTKVRGMFVHPGAGGRDRAPLPRSANARGWWSSGEMANDR